LGSGIPGPSLDAVPTPCPGDSFQLARHRGTHILVVTEGLTRFDAGAQLESATTWMAFGPLSAAPPENVGAQQQPGALERIRAVAAHPLRGNLGHDEQPRPSGHPPKRPDRRAMLLCCHDETRGPP